MKALVGIVVLLVAGHLCYAEEATYPTLKVGDETYKNVRVVKATPIELTLLYDGGGRTIKLEDLPAELKAKYPYNAAKAAEYKRKHAAEQKALAEDQQKRWQQDAAATRAALLSKEQKLREKIEPLQVQIDRLQRDINTQRRIAGTTAKNSAAHKKLNEMRKEMIPLRDQKESLTDQINTVRKQREKLEP
jgi:chromosome segregation ATPase